MIKGLIALFTSGIIFSPMVLLGIVSGSYCIVRLSPEQIRSLFLDARFYAVVVGVSVINTVVFDKVYQDSGEDVDWLSTFMKMIWNTVRYFIAFVLSLSFVMMISIF